MRALETGGGLNVPVNNPGARAFAGVGKVAQSRAVPNSSPNPQTANQIATSQAVTNRDLAIRAAAANQAATSALVTYRDVYAHLPSTLAAQNQAATSAAVASRDALVHTGGGNPTRPAPKPVPAPKPGGGGFTAPPAAKSTTTYVSGGGGMGNNWTPLPSPQDPGGTAGGLSNPLSGDVLGRLGLSVPRAIELAAIVVAGWLGIKYLNRKAGGR